MPSARQALEPTPLSAPPSRPGERRPFLVFDVETNGLPRHVASGEIAAVRAVRLAWGLYDARGRERAFHDAIVFPDGFEIPAGATRIHGITTERARLEGRPLAEVLGPFVAALANVRGLVAHGLRNFDFPVIGEEIGRAGLATAVPDVDVDLEDTARLMWQLYPGEDSHLPEAHAAVVGRPMAARVDGVHDAADDVRACAALFFVLRDRRRHRLRHAEKRGPRGTTRNLSLSGFGGRRTGVT